jgi:hypothetical protein
MIVGRQRLPNAGPQVLLARALPSIPVVVSAADDPPAASLTVETE